MYAKVFYPAATTECFFNHQFACPMPASPLAASQAAKYPLSQSVNGYCDPSATSSRSPLPLFMSSSEVIIGIGGQKGSV